MKKHYYDSLSSFYNDIRNEIGTERFVEEENDNRPEFRGLGRMSILESKFSYPFGVEKLKNMKDFEVQKDIKVKYWDQFDGYDIDIDRMHDNLDFLLNQRKVRKLPHTMDIFINVTENAHVDYMEMLNKTYAALKVVDRLETLGVRTGLYVVISCAPKVGSSYGEDLYIEICVKQYADTVNLGALCTSISPWFFRYWFFLWIIGKYRGLSESIGQAKRIPVSEKRAGNIYIDHGQCLTSEMANHFIGNIKIAQR